MKIVTVFKSDKFSSFMKLLDIFLAIIMCLTWASDYLVSKEILEIVPPILLSALRFFIVACLTIPFCRRMPPYPKSLFLMSFAVVVLTYGFADIGIHLNDSTTVANLIMECNIIISIIFAAIFLGEKINRKIITGTSIAFLGVLLIVVGESFSFNSRGGYELSKNNIISILALLVAICGWPTYTVASKKLEDKLSTIEIIAWTALIGSIQAFIISLLFESTRIKALDVIDGKSVLLILYTGVGGVIIPHRILHYLMRKYDVSRVSMISLMVPLFVAIGSYFLFNERLGVTVAFGGILISIGIYFANVSGHKVEHLDLLKKIPEDLEDLNRQENL